jgi:hypothetical protein
MDDVRCIEGLLRKIAPYRDKTQPMLHKECLSFKPFPFFPLGK